MPLKRPPKYKAPVPKVQIIPSLTSTTVRINKPKTRIKTITEEYISKTKADIKAFNRMFSTTDYSYPINA